jgi:hypothetical protein
MDPGTTNVDAAKTPHFSHKGWSAFFGSGTMRNGFSMAFQASATCSLSGQHVASAAVGEGLTSTVILPVSMLSREELHCRREEAAAAVGGAMPKRKWCVVCVTYRTLLGEASENREVATK